MKTLLKLWSNRHVLKVLLGAVLGVHLVSWGFHANLNQSEWASWVQAVGSVVAICAAIWIANRDNRKRDHDAYTLAMVAATEMFEPLGEVVNSVFAARNCVASSGNIAFTRERLTMARETLTNLRRWSSDDIHRLTPLPDNCARRIARAQLSITMFVKHSLADWIIEATVSSSDESRVEWCRSSAAELIDIADDLQKALQVLSESSRRITKPGEHHLSDLINRPPAR